MQFRDAVLTEVRTLHLHHMTIIVAIIYFFNIQ